MQSNNDVQIIVQTELQDQVRDPEFLISKERLTEVVETTNQTDDDLQRWSVIENIISALKTNVDTGITGDQRDIHFRRNAFGSNLSSQELSPPPKREPLKRLLLDAFRDTCIILLLCCATLSLVIGIKRNGLEEGIVDGVLILLAISLVVSFGAIFRFFKAKWMIKKSRNKHKNAAYVYCVVRNGEFQKISESEIAVGDIIFLQTGDQVPADGIFIDGDSFQLNDGVEKKFSSNNPSLFNGAKVVKGHCRMLVTSVGENTERIRLIRSICINDQHQNDDHQKPAIKPQLLDAIDKTNSKLEKIYLSLSLLLLTVQLVRCFVWKPDKDRNMDPKGVKNTMGDLMNESIKLMKRESSSKANGLVTLLCILLFASREGLPLAIFITLLYASNEMKKLSCGAMIQKLPASATIGLVTTIVCTGETTDLVLQHTKMAELWVGFDLIHDVHRQLDNRILDALQEGIFVRGLGNNGEEDLCLFAWARAVLDLHNMELHGDCSVEQYEASEIDKNLSCIVVKKGNSNGENKELHVHWKGAPKHILFMCSHYYTLDGTIETLDENKRTVLIQLVQGGQCFAFAYKRVVVVVEEEEEEEEEATKTLKTLEHGLTLLGFVGLKNPYPPEVRKAIQDCRKSGVQIRLLVEKDINTARIMALNCGLLSPDEDDNNNGAVIEAADFRSSSEENRMNMIENVRIMANSTPADKLLMVQCLRQKGEVVAATASSIRDCPMLKEADVGIFMGDDDKCAEISKEDGDILVQDKNFSQIPGIINLGRRVCENLEKLILLQLTLEISAFAVNFIAVAAVSKEELSPFQVLWVNLIMEVLGSLAVAITTVYRSSRDKYSEPVYGSGRVVTRTMYRSVALQSFFQVTVILVLGTKGKAIFKVDGLALKTMVFNCYASCQVFLLMTAIELEKKYDSFGGLFRGKNWLFIWIVTIIGILQVALVEIMAVLGHWAKLDVRKWCICIGIASLSVPLRFLANWIPTAQ